MGQLRRTRITLLVALLVATAILAYIAGHPELYAPHLGRLLTRNLMRDAGASFTARDLAGNPLDGYTFYRISLTRQGDDGSFVYLSADSLLVRYDLPTLLRREWTMERVVLGGAEVLIRKAPESRNRARSGDHRRLSLDASIAVKDFRIEGLGLTLTSAEGLIEESFSGLHLRAEMRPGLTEGIDLRVDELEAAMLSRGTNVRAFRGDVHLALPRLELRGAYAELDSTVAHLDLGLSFTDSAKVGAFTLEGRGKPFVMQEVFRLLKLGQAPALEIDGSASLDFTFERMRILGQGEGVIGGAPVRASEFEGTLLPGKLIFDRIVGSYLGAEGVVSGDLRFDDPRLRLSGHAWRANTADPWTGQDLGWPASDLAADFDLELDLRPTIQLDLRLRDGGGILLDLPVDSVTTHLSFDEDTGLVVHEGSLLVFGTTIQGTGTVVPEGRVELDVTAQADTLDAWSRHLNVPVRGWGLNVEGRIQGDVEAPALSFGGQLEGFTAAGLVCGQNQVEVSLDRFDRLENMTVKLQSPDLHVERRHLGALEVELRRDAPTTLVHKLRIASQDSSLNANGLLREQGDGLLVRLDGLTLTAGQDTWDLMERTTALLRPGGFSIEGIELENETGTGRFGLEGALEYAGAMALHLSVREGDISTLTRAGLVDAQLAGRITAELDLRGTVDDPEVELELDLRSATVEERPLDRLRVDLGVRGNSFDLRTADVESPAGLLTVRGQIEIPTASWMRELLRDPSGARVLWERGSVDLNVEAEEIEPFAWISPDVLPPPLTGRFGGRLHVAGPNSSPDVQGTVRARELVAGGVHVPTAEARLRLENGDVLLEQGWLLAPDPWVRFESRLPLELSLARAPHWQPERGMRLWIDSGKMVDLSPVSAIWPHFEEFSGKGALQFEATGDPRQPMRSGYITVREGIVRYEGTLERIREIEVDADFRDGILVIERAQGREGMKGKIDARGEIVFKGLLPDDIWLDIDVSRFLLTTVPYLRAIATGQGPLELRLVRPAVPGASRVPQLSGSVFVDKAIYQGDFAEQGQDPSLGATAAPDWMAQLQVQLQDQVRISNRDLDLLVAGDADYIRDERGVRLRGVVEIIQGRMPIFGNDFTLIEGTLDFSRRPLEPEVDIVAETKMPISSDDRGPPQLERVTVYFTGTFAEPELRFESESNLPETTILRALVGFDDRQEAPGAAGVGDVGVRAGFNILERGLTHGYARQLGLDTIDIEADEATFEELERTRIAVGKYVTIPGIDRPGYLRYSQGFRESTWGLFVEYQLWWNFIISGGYENRPEEEGTTRYNADLKWRLRR